MISTFHSFFDRHVATVRQLLYLSFPILAAHIAAAFVPFINGILAGQHSALAVAATGLANTTFTAIMGFGWGIIASVGILTAGQLGRVNDVTKTGRILKSSLLTTLILTIPIMGILKFMEPVWLFFGQSPEIARMGQNYLDGLFWLVFVDLAKFGIFQFAIAHNRVQAPFVATVVSIPLIWMLNTNWIARWGVYGLGAGTAVIYWIVFVLLWIYLYKDRLFRQCMSYKMSINDYIDACCAQFKLGIPMGAMSSIELLFFVIIGLWVGRISTNHLVAHQIAMQWLHLIIMAAVSFAEAVTILVAKAHAQNSVRNTLRFLWWGTFLTAIFMTLIAFVYWLNPHLIIGWNLADHAKNPQLIELTILTLALCGVFQIFDGVRIVLSGVLRGLADTQYPMWITLIAFWIIGLPISYITTFVLHWNITGLWLGMIIAVIVMIILQYHRMQKRLTELH